jgi:hypothetical protein
LKSAKALAEARVNYAKQGTQEELDARIAAIQAGSRLELANADLTAGERVKIQSDAEKAIRDLRFEFATRELTDMKARVEAQLAIVREGSEEEFDLRLSAINAQARIDLHNQALTENQRLAIIRNAAKAREQIENERSVSRAENAKAIIDKELQAVELGAREREGLLAASLEKQREIEILGAKENQEKIAEINARYDRQISDTRLRIRTEEMQRELELNNILATMAASEQDRLAQRAKVRAEDPNLSFRSRKAAFEQYMLFQLNSIKVTENAEINSINKRRTALDKALREGQISHKDYETEFAKLKAEEVKVHGDAEDKKTALTKEGSEERKGSWKAEFEKFAEAAAGVLDGINNLAASFSEQAMQRIEAAQKENENLRELGAITEKEFLARQKRLEREEIAAKIRQARREKTLQLFQAVINGARAVVEALPDPFKVATAILISSLQIAAIAARPLPKFGKGVKKAPRGLAEVGETGTEIVQTDKGYYLANHPQVIWLKGGERIYNPAETKVILNQATPRPTPKDKMARNGSNQPLMIDYNRLSKGIGEEIGKHPRFQVHIDERGFAVREQGYTSRTTYQNKRYTFGA